MLAECAYFYHFSLHHLSFLDSFLSSSYFSQLCCLSLSLFKVFSFLLCSFLLLPSDIHHQTTHYVFTRCPYLLTYFMLDDCFLDFPLIFTYCWSVFFLILVVLLCSFLFLLYIMILSSNRPTFHLYLFSLCVSCILLNFLLSLTSTK